MRGTCPPKRPVERLVQSCAGIFRQPAGRVWETIPAFRGKQFRVGTDFRRGGAQEQALFKNAANGPFRLVPLQHDPSIIFSAKTPLRALYGASATSQCLFPTSFWPFRTSYEIRGGVPPACAGEFPPRLCLFPKNATRGVLRACFSLRDYRFVFS